VGLLAAQAPDNSWIEAPMTTPRNSHTLTLLLDGRVLAAGGWDGASPLASAELYDPATGAWQPASPMSVARVFPTASLLPDGRVLVAGGWNTLGVALTGTEVYDPGANAWRPGPALRAGRAGHTATRLSDGRVLVAGGYTEGGLPAAAELYDPVKDTWLSAGSLRTARAHHTATRLPDGRVLVVGGWDGANRPLASAELYDPTRDAWTPAAGLATARLDHSATLLPDGTVLVVGGWDGSYLASAEVYDPARDAWTPAGSLGAGRAYHTAVLLADGRAAVLGGSDGERASDGVELYDSRARGWSVAGRLGRAYASQQALVLRDGKLLITGRPDSGDLTGNDGYPTPTQTPTPAGRTPGALDWLLTPRPTATPGAGKGKGANTAEENVGRAGNLTYTAAAVIDSDNVSVTETRSQANSLTQGQSASYFNYTSGTEMATRYGVHEVSFQRSLQSGENPFDLAFWVTFTPPTGSGSLPKTVRAFWDGDATWRARAYVDVAGIWSWSSTTGDGGSFTVSERSESGLHGMLRVGTAPNKRWYTDDGRTFLPMADTAYRLFFETSSPHPGCPVRTPTQADDFVKRYADAVVAHGINVLRVEALGTWAYEPELRNPNDCETDLSLFFWSNTPGDPKNSLFDGGPTMADLNSGSYSPNLESFRRTDHKLEMLLTYSPTLYIQMLLVPEPCNRCDSGWGAEVAGDDGSTGSLDSTWLSANGVPSALRQQLWRTMVARWAAFPNVFWSISNDLGDADTTSPDPYYHMSYPNNRDLAQEVGIFFTSPSSGGDPWYVGRPMSFGHLRNRIDSFITTPWHTYITAYSDTDISAQQMDGTTGLPENWPAHTETFQYASQSQPTFNTEDMYETRCDDDVACADTDYKLIKSPDYFFRRLFWASLLSGSGATYGSDSTWPGFATYVTATYTTTLSPYVGIPLVGLNSLQNIPSILRDARIDLGRFIPADTLVPKSDSGQWAEFDRAQVARRGVQEILAYIPNTAPASPLVPNQKTRRGAAAATTGKTINVDMTAFTNTVYAVTWYNPTTGLSVVPPDGVVTVTGNITGAQQALRMLTTPPGDAVLHISPPWCPTPNVCEPMDDEPSLGTTNARGFWADVGENAQLVRDTRQVAIDYTDSATWRCDNGECTVDYAFPSRQSIASADVYFRRNAAGAEFGTSLHESNPISGTLVEPDSIVTHVYPSGALETVTSAMGSGGSLYLEGAAPALNRWYHLATRAERDSSNTYRVKVSLDGALIFDSPIPGFATGDPQFDSVTVGASGAPGSSVWLDELSVDPATPTEIHGLLRAFLQQGLGDYSGATATYFDGSGGYNNTALLHVGANNVTKGLLRFDVANIPTAAVIDEAVLQLYNTGRSNGNTLTLGAHRVLADWIDAEANKTQRKNGVNWNVVGMGSGSDYTAAAAATASLTGAGNAWIDLNITGLAQAWVSDPAANLGLVLTQETASGYVVYDFCSELGWPPCTAAQAPKLTLRYHLAPPPPVKATFQQGVSGYSGANATYFDGAAGYNNTSQWHVGQSNSMKALLRFALPTLPITATVDEATLRLYQTSRSNGNTLTLRAEPQDEALGAHQVLAAWIDAEANKTQRQTGVNWAVVGMGSGSDYVAEADGTADLASAGGVWIDLDVKAMVQAWIANPDDNHGLVLTQEAASGAVYYNFCSELGWSPCTAVQAPKLTIWYH